MNRWLLPAVVVAGTVSTLACANDTDSLQGWRVAEPDYDTGLIERLDTAIRNAAYRDINSVVVARDGKLLLDRYYNGAKRDTTHNPRSVGKTFAGAVLGIAIDEGHIAGIDARLADFYDLQRYDNISPKKGAVTLEQLLTMTSGFEGFDFDPESVGNEERMYPTANWVRWTLNLPMAADREPGDAWRYFTAGVVVLGDILNSHVPGGLEAYAHDRLFEPLRITNYRWQHTPQRVANTAGGIQLTPLGFARFGQLYLDGGRHDGRQVLPEAWVRASLDDYVDTTVPGNRYGYLWWHKTYTVDGEDWPTAYCSGNGGNKIFLFPERRVVIVVTASAYGRAYMHSQVDEMLERYLLPPLKSPPDAGEGRTASCDEGGRPPRRSGTPNPAATPHPPRQ